MCGHACGEWDVFVCQAQHFFSSSSSSGCNSLLAQQGLVDQSLLLSQLCNVVHTSVSFDRPSKQIVTPVHHVASGREVAEGIECCILKEEV